MFERTKIRSRDQALTFCKIRPELCKGYYGSPNMPAGHDEAWWRINFHRFASMWSGWKKYKESLDSQRDDSERLKKLREFADYQFRETDKLLNRLNGYAIDNAVPMEWREY